MRIHVSRAGAWLCAIVMLGAFPALAQQPEKPSEKRPEQAAAKKPEPKKDLPLEPTRKIEFTTDEATWLSLDVAPDGKTIVFELLGDLYTVGLDGGEAKRITDGLAYDSQPRYSPDGKWLAFVSDRSGADNLWIAKADGTEPRALTKEQRGLVISPAWAPDSQYVVAQKGADLWLYHIYGGSGINVTGAAAAPGAAPAAPGAGMARRGPAFSPDGRFLYYSQRPASIGVYNQMNFGWQVVRRDMQHGNVDTITQAQGAAIRPVISPDGRWLVYGTRFETKTGLRLRDLNSGDDRWLLYPITRDDMESASTRDLLPSYAFLPDSKELVLTSGGKIHRLNLSTGVTRPVPFSAKVTLDVGALARFQRRVETGAVRSRLLQNPTLSPDGKRLAFSAMGHIYVTDLPVVKPVRLTQSDANEFKPAWSPDGRSIAYVTWDYAGEGHIWKVSSDGAGRPQRLTNTAAFYTDPVFSPDGQRIVARSGNAWMRAQTPSEFGGLRISLDLVWLPAAGGDTKLIVPARGLSTPHFTRDSERIYFYSNEGLLSMRYDGTDRRIHLRVTGTALQPNQPPPPAWDALMSPDGRWALARINHQLYAMAVPQVGNPVPSVSVASGSVPVQRITDIGADSYAWAEDGKSVVWSVGSTLFRRPFSSISFEPEKPAEKKEEGETKPEEKKPEGDAKPAAGQEAEKEKVIEKKEEPKKPKEEDKAVEAIEVALEFPRHTPKGSVVLRGATLLTMKGDEQIANADVVVTDNRIVALGKRGSVTIPAGAKVMDVRGHFIVPGFVDTHAHYEMRTEGVLELYNWSYLANLAYGVTTGLDVQTSTNDYLTYTDLVETGRMIGPRSYSTGPGVFGYNDFQSYEAAKFTLEKYKKYYHNNNLKAYVSGNRKQRQWVVRAANELQITTTTEGALDLKLDSTHAIDGFGGNEHTLPIMPLYKDVIELFAQSKTSYTPTLLVLYGGPWAENFFYETTEVHDDAKLNRFIPHNEIDANTRRRPWFRKDEHAFPLAAEQAAKIQRAGGLVGVGGHGQLQGLGFHWEMWSLAMGGMKPAEVLRAATIDGARIIGLEQDLGSIEPGKLADLVILQKNPLGDIRNTNSIRWVMMNGELYEGDSLKQIYPRERELPPLWWWKDAPKTQTTTP